MTATIKVAIEEAFTQVGGADYLARMAILQPVAFMTLLGKVLPSQIEHSSPDGSMSPPSLSQFMRGLADGANPQK